MDDGANLTQAPYVIRQAEAGKNRRRGAERQTDERGRQQHRHDEPPHRRWRRAADAEQGERAAIFAVVRHRDREDGDRGEHEAAEQVDPHVGQRERNVHVAPDFAYLLRQAVDLERRERRRADDGVLERGRIDRAVGSQEPDDAREH